MFFFDKVSSKNKGKVIAEPVKGYAKQPLEAWTNKFQGRTQRARPATNRGRRTTASEAVPLLKAPEPLPLPPPRLHFNW